MPVETSNKYRTAIEILQSGRDLMVESLAEEILDRQEDLIEGGFLLNEFLESQGARLHFLSLLVGYLEQSAEAWEEAQTPPPAPRSKKNPSAKRGQKSKKLARSTSGKGTSEENP